jgi:hypothetical protein
MDAAMTEVENPSDGADGGAGDGCAIVRRIIATDVPELEFQGWRRGGGANIEAVLRVVGRQGQTWRGD